MPNEGSEGLVFLAQSKLYALMEESENLIKLTDDPDLYLQSLTPIREFFEKFSLAAQWIQNKPSITPSNTAFLRVMGAIVNKTIPEFLIFEAELKQIKVEFQNLRQTIGEAEIGAAMKAALLRAISNILDAIENYNFVGAAGLRRVAAIAVGELVIEKKGRFDGESEPEWARKYMTVVGHLADLAALVMVAQPTVEALADIVNKVLPPITM